MRSGFVRAVDQLGRISLPTAYMELLTIAGGDAVELTEHDGRIAVKPLAANCVFCGGESSLMAFKSRWVCRACLDEVPDPAMGTA